MDYEVNPAFQPKMPFNYPPHQRGLLIEEYAYEYFKRNFAPSKYTYLPIFWTAFHVSRGFGKDKQVLQEYVNSLPKKKYWSIVQYDDGTLVDFECKTFCCAFKGDYPIPVLCDWHKEIRLPKRYWACFMGNLKTHPIRQEMRRALYGVSGIVVKDKLNTKFYVEDLCRSYFALCPRGYGLTSFRLYEAMALGVIPIYISDIFWLPFQNKIDWEKCAVLIKDNEMNKIEGRIRGMTPGEMEDRKEYIKKISEEYFTMEGCCKEIANIVRTMP